MPRWQNGENLHLSKMKKLIYLLLFSLPLLVHGQSKTLEVGSKIKVLPCKKGQSEYQSMDIYARTTPYNKSHVDSLSGEGLLQEFFNDKSIDAKRLPCSMGGYTYTVAALQEIDDKGKTKRVVLCYTKYELTLIWIELDAALELGEISF